jgi:hypothetical protein
MTRERKEIHLEGLPLWYRRRTAHLLLSRLSFEPFKNPTIEWSVFSNQLTAVFEYVPLGEGKDGVDNWRVETLVNAMASDIARGESAPRLKLDEVLGLLMWENRFSQWKAELEYPADQFVRLTIQPFPYGGRIQRLWQWIRGPILPQKLINLAQKLATEVASHDAEWRANASAELLPVYNDHWNDGAQISDDEFQSHISLDSIALDERGECVIYYDDGDLFSNHLIALDVDAEGRIKRVYLAG